MTGQDAHGSLRLDNGYLKEWGYYPMSSMTYDGNTGGYVATINLSNTFVGMAAPRTDGYYASGMPATCVHNLTATTIKIGSAVNVAGGIVYWQVEGSWK